MGATAVSPSATLAVTVKPRGDNKSGRLRVPVGRIELYTVLLSAENSTVGLASRPSKESIRWSPTRLSPIAGWKLPNHPGK